MAKVTKHSYSIEINGGAKIGIKQFYSFRSTKDISIIIGTQKATISFLYGPLKKPEEFTELKDKLFRDALRKAYLLHAFLKNEGLAIKTINYRIDNDSYSFDWNTPNFPFVFSMIPSRELNLSKEWQNDEVIAFYAGATKTASDMSYCNCAALAYLASKSRSYQTDRFLNLWTAMNAYYNNIAKMFEDGLDARGIKKTSSNKVLNIDNASLGSLICTKIKSDCYITKKYNETEEYKQLYLNTNKMLVACVKDGGKELYEKSLAHLDNSVPEDDPYYPLFEAAENAGYPLFVHLLVLYPYLLRCNYFHGSKVQPVISGFNDPELFDLRIICYFLETFLNQKIPEMFIEKEMSDEDFANITHFCKARK